MILLALAGTLKQVAICGPRRRASRRGPIEAREQASLVLKFASTLSKIGLNKAKEGRAQHEEESTSVHCSWPQTATILAELHCRDIPISSHHKMLVIFEMLVMVGVAHVCDLCSI